MMNDNRGDQYLLDARWLIGNGRRYNFERTGGGLISSVSMSASGIRRYKLVAGDLKAGRVPRWRRRVVCGRI